MLVSATFSKAQTTYITSRLKMQLKTPVKGVNSRTQQLNLR